MALFGSFARGEENADSDIDILISFKNPSLLVLSEVKLLLESLFKRKVDLISENTRTSRDFMDNIEKDLIYV